MFSPKKNLVTSKKVETHMKNFGVAYPALHPETFRLQQKNSTSSRFKKKLFIMPSGKEVFVQGAEPIILNKLLNEYLENDILLGVDIPVFDYFDESTNQNRKYYPDIYIPKDNLIIEVKSSYTFEKDYLKNKCKEKAVKNQGYNFKFMVVDKLNNIIEK